MELDRPKGNLQGRQAEVIIPPCSSVQYVCMHVAHFFAPRHTEHF